MKAVDASLAIKLVVREQDSHIAHALWSEWAEQGEVRVAPGLFVAETVSAIRRLVYRGILSQAAGDFVFARLRGLEIDVMEPLDLYERAWRLAGQLNRPVVYDCLYLALAESLDCDLWTADERFWRVAHPQFPRVHTLGDFEAGSPGEMPPVR